MKEYTITRYSFTELDEKAREKAIEKARHDLYVNMPEEFISIPLEEKLSELIPNADLQLRYDLSYSQGSGLSVKGTIRREDTPDLAWPDKATRCDITNGHRYVHAFTMVFDFTDDEGESVDTDGKVFRDQVMSVCRELEKYGYRLIEAESSEETAIAYLTDMEEVFLSDGTISFPLGEKVSA